MDKILNRFLKYISFETESDINSNECPSTIGQYHLANYLYNELIELGLTHVNLDSNGYLMAELPSNISEKKPTIGFIAHMDTSPDFTSQNIDPQIIKNYDGKEIILNLQENIKMDTVNFPELENYIGQTLITTNGKTLLGADDKAGIAAIVSAMEFLIQNPAIPHGTIKIGFTPDEEIGRGANLFDVTKFNADWAYTIDGGEIGELEFENFNAAVAFFQISGVSVHPGYAFNKMINANLVANQLINKLPANEIPSKTKGYEGFYHITNLEAIVSSAEIHILIRDHDLIAFNNRKQYLNDCATDINKLYGRNLVTLTIEDQYLNMKDKITPHFHIIDLAIKAMKKSGVEPKIKPVRGGTDGARLSFMGLPCPNLFAGGHNFHGPYEFIPLESMEKAKEVIVNICRMA